MKIIKTIGVKKVGTKNATLTFVLVECECCHNLFERPLSVINKNPSSKCRKCSKINHGDSKHNKIYYAWVNMKTRICNKKYVLFESYGGRGITICDEWVNSYVNFKKWAINNGFDVNLTLDRINVNGNYEPNNCRWTTNTIQARNTRLLCKVNTSGYRGVRFRKDNKKWQARIMVNYKSISIGHFKSDIEAAKAYDKYVINNGLEHPINFPNQIL